MLAHGQEASVEFLAGVADFIKIFDHHLLTPAMSDGEKQRDEGDGSGDQDAALHAVIEESGVVVESGAE